VTFVRLNSGFREVRRVLAGFFDEERKVEEISLENIKVATKQAPKQEESSVKMKRLTEKLRFRMREAGAQRGRSDAFLHWLQTDSARKA
jgi:lipase chaperone LimK